MRAMWCRGSQLPNLIVRNNQRATFEPVSYLHREVLSKQQQGYQV